jgi:glycosyltransferase involved in cell wall biosynthesis
VARIALIVPAYGHWDYVRKTVESFFEHTPGDSRCYVLDDHGPGWYDVDWASWPAHVVVPSGTGRTALSQVLPADLGAPADAKTLCFRFARHSGLTRSWNTGLFLASSPGYWGADYAVCGNSDIVFTPGWDQPLVDALEKADLAGPTTNASGRVFNQHVSRFAPGYKLTDSPEYLCHLAEQLRQQHADKIVRTWRINGFFMMAKTSKWQDGAFSTTHVFDPSAGMDNVAYELQARWRRKHMPIAIVPSSFVLHYRSVSRGRRGLKGKMGRGALRAKPKQ